MLHLLVAAVDPASTPMLGVCMSCTRCELHTLLCTPACCLLVFQAAHNLLLARCCHTNGRACCTHTIIMSADKTGIQVEGLAKHSDVDASEATQTGRGTTLQDQPGLQAPSPVPIESTRIPTAVGRRDALELREYRLCMQVPQLGSTVSSGAVTSSKARWRW